MRKKTLVMLFILGLILECVALVPVVMGIAAISSQCSNGTCTTVPGLAIFGFILAGILSLAGTVLLAISWIGVLIKQAQRQQWAWFVLTILFSYITMVIYWIAVPESSPAMQQAYGQPYQQPTPRGW